MSTECAGVTVQKMNPAHHGGPVFYASLKGDSETCKERLIAILWDHLVAMESPLWHHCQSSQRTVLPLQVVCSRLGRPYLQLGECRGPAISFSKGGGKVWAALCGDEADIGIDVAGTDEFQQDYPFHRVFHPDELHHALRLTGGELAEASALLWSIKEAAVKALGCAFHLVDPRQINVYPSAGDAAGGGSGHAFPVGLTGKAKVRFPLAASSPLWVRSLPQGKLWLSIAHVKQKTASP